MEDISLYRLCLWEGSVALSLHYASRGRGFHSCMGFRVGWVRFMNLNAIFYVHAYLSGEGVHRSFLSAFQNDS